MLLSDSLVHLTPEEAAGHLTAAAFEVTDPESSDFGRKIVHCFAGSFGADWDLETALETVRTARDVAWVHHLAGHDLAVLTEEGRLRFFDVKRPTTAVQDADAVAPMVPVSPSSGERVSAALTGQDAKGGDWS